MYRKYKISNLNTRDFYFNEVPVISGTIEYFVSSTNYLDDYSKRYYVFRDLKIQIFDNINEILYPTQFSTDEIGNFVIDFTEILNDIDYNKFKLIPGKNAFSLYITDNEYKIPTKLQDLNFDILKIQPHITIDNELIYFRSLEPLIIDVELPYFNSLVCDFDIDFNEPQLEVFIRDNRLELMDSWIEDNHVKYSFRIEREYFQHDENLSNIRDILIKNPTILGLKIICYETTYTSQYENILKIPVDVYTIISWDDLVKHYNSGCSTDYYYIPSEVINQKYNISLTVKDEDGNPVVDQPVNININNKESIGTDGIETMPIETITRLSTNGDQLYLIAEPITHKFPDINYIKPEVYYTKPLLFSGEIHINNFKLVLSGLTILGTGTIIAHNSDILVDNCLFENATNTFDLDDSRFSFNNCDVFDCSENFIEARNSQLSINNNNVYNTNLYPSSNVLFCQAYNQTNLELNHNKFYVRNSFYSYDDFLGNGYSLFEFEKHSLINNEEIINPHDLLKIIRMNSFELYVFYPYIYKISDKIDVQTCGLQSPQKSFVLFNPENEFNTVSIVFDNQKYVLNTYFSLFMGLDINVCKPNRVYGYKTDELFNEIINITKVIHTDEDGLIFGDYILPDKEYYRVDIDV